MISKPSIIDKSFLFDHVSLLKELLEGGLECLVGSPVRSPEEVPVRDPEEVLVGGLEEVLSGLNGAT